MHEPVRILTFDIEEWFNLLDIDATRSVDSWDTFERRIHENTDRILSLIKDTGCRATFFCLGWIAEKYPEVIRSITAEGYEIGTHTHTHQLAYEMTPDQFRNDLGRSVGIIEGITGMKVRCFRVPGFSITESNTWALETLVKLGITIDSSIFPAGRGHGGFPSYKYAVPSIIRTPSGDLKEFPINTAQILGKPVIFSGGGYFRLFPYSFLRMLTGSASYVMTYFHPRDFDPRQPVIANLPLHRKFKSYYGLSGALKKLKKLINEFNFIDIAEAEQQINWENVPVVKVN